mgnify:CR=1 FL=1
MPSKSTNSPKKVNFGFDAKNKNAQVLAERFSAERVRQLNKETKIAVQLIVKQSIREGIPPREAAKLIRKSVGLNRPQALALKRYAGNLSPTLSAKAKATAEFKYQQKMIRRRAITIARTEVIDSLTAGMELSWGQAQQQGLLGANAQKEWMTTPFGACRICQALDGQAVPLNKLFTSSTVGGLQRPTAHPNCRCGIAPVPGIGGGMVPAPVEPPTGDMLKTVTVKKKGKPPEKLLRPRWDSSQFTPAKGAEDARETLDRFVEKWVDVDGVKRNPAVYKGDDLTPIFTPDRLRLHDEIVEKMLKEASPVDTPQFTVLGGGPASGKTAAKDAAMKAYKKNAVAVDPDEIRAMLPEYEEGLAQFARNAAAVTHEEASGLAKRVIEEGQRRKLNMIMDGTGDGGYGKFAKKVAKYKKDGATKITANYVTIDTDEAMKRMEARARKTELDPETGKIGKGGRWVPEHVLRGTHKSVSEVVPKALKDGIFHEFRLWDNNAHGKPPEVIAYLNKRTKGKLKVVNRKKWNAFLAKGDETWDTRREFKPPKKKAKAKAKAKAKPPKKKPPISDLADRTKIADDIKDANPEQLLYVETWKRHTVGFHEGGGDFQKYGNPIFSKERLKLHDEILERTLKGVTPVKNPEVVVLGGGPASGKTAAKNAAKRHFKNNVAAVDPDDIRTMLPEYDELLGLTADDQLTLTTLRKTLIKQGKDEGKSVTDDFLATVDDVVAKRKKGMIQENVEAGIASREAASITHEEASALAKRIMAEGQKRKLNMIADGTGDNTYESLAGKVAQFRARGATKVTGSYVSIPADEAMKRMKERAMKSGRWVPEHVLRGTHASVSRVVPQAIKRDLFDSFTLWDNSVDGEDAVVIAKWTKDRGLQINPLEKLKWKKFVDKGEVGLDAKALTAFRLEIRALSEEYAWPVLDDEVRYMGSKSYQDEIRDRYRKYSNTLSEDTRFDINEYSGFEYHEINKELREFPDQKLTGRTARIQEALEDAPKPPPPELVWRGVDGLEFSDFKNGEVIDLDGFQSTSIDPFFASKWNAAKPGQKLFEIRPTRGMFIGDVAKDLEEMEFLIPHNAKYRVVGRRKVKIGVESEEVRKWDVHATAEEVKAMGIKPADQTVEEAQLIVEWKKRSTYFTKRTVAVEREVIQLEMIQ